MDKKAKKYEKNGTNKSISFGPQSIAAGRYMWSFFAFSYIGDRSIYDSGHFSRHIGQNLVSILSREPVDLSPRNLRLHLYYKAKVTYLVSLFFFVFHSNTNVHVYSLHGSFRYAIPSLLGQQ